MTHERLERRMEAAEAREERATRCSHWKTCLHGSCRASRPEITSEAIRREARARRAGFGSYAEEERHSR